MCDHGFSGFVLDCACMSMIAVGVQAFCVLVSIISFSIYGFSVRTRGMCVRVSKI